MKDAFSIGVACLGFGLYAKYTMVLPDDGENGIRVILAFGVAFCAGALCRGILERLGR